MLSSSRVSEYRDIIVRTINEILNIEREGLERASDLMVDSIANGRMIYVLGTGHSALIAMEIFYRAGGLARIYPILDPSITIISGAVKSSLVERLSGYADILLNYYPISRGDTLIVISNSGKNAVPVEAAVMARDRGAHTIAITSIEYSKRLKPENRYGRRLFEVADVVIDNRVPEGDVVIEIEELGGVRIAPISTIVNAFIAHSLEILVIEKLIKRGIEPEIWVSVNIPRGSERNRALIEKYIGLIKHL